MLATYYLDEDEDDSDSDSDDDSSTPGDESTPEVDGRGGGTLVAQGLQKEEEDAIVEGGGDGIQEPLVSPITNRVDGHIIRSRGSSRSRSRSRSSSKSRTEMEGMLVIGGVSPLVDEFPIQIPRSEGDEAVSRSGGWGGVGYGGGLWEEFFWVKYID